MSKKIYARRAPNETTAYKFGQYIADVSHALFETLLSLWYLVRFGSSQIRERRTGVSVETILIGLYKDEIRCAIYNPKAQEVINTLVKTYGPMSLTKHDWNIIEDWLGRGMQLGVVTSEKKYRSDLYQLVREYRTHKEQIRADRRNRHLILTFFALFILSFLVHSSPDAQNAIRLVQSSLYHSKILSSDEPILKENTLTIESKPIKPVQAPPSPWPVEKPKITITVWFTVEKPTLEIVIQKPAQLVAVRQSRSQYTSNVRKNTHSYSLMAVAYSQKIQAVKHNIPKPTYKPKPFKPLLAQSQPYVNRHVSSKPTAQVRTAHVPPKFKAHIVTQNKRVTSYIVARRQSGGTVRIPPKRNHVHTEQIARVPTKTGLP